jgi:SAM-dependent methyltransferase
MAGGYRGYSAERERYIAAVNGIVRKNINEFGSIIDFGAGDGVRTGRIAAALSCRLALVENSEKMLGRIRKNMPDADIIKSDFSSLDFDACGKFNMAICLWNVLGHMAGRRKVFQALINIRKSLREDGMAVIDVNNRHNIRQYGWKAVRNIIKDSFNYKYANGDIEFSIVLSGRPIPASVHLFTKSEIEKLFLQAGLRIIERIPVNYKTGDTEISHLCGQLCYILSAEK